MNFHDINLPKYIEIFAVGSSSFSTSKAESMSGREARNSDSQMPKRLYELRNCCLSSDQFEAFNSFFYARRGMRFSFRLRDYFDCSVENQNIGISDGMNPEFQLKKLYRDDISPYVRIITKPVQDTVILLHENDRLEFASINYNDGKLRLIEPLPLNSILSASFTFDVPVRFLNDTYEYRFNDDGSILIDNVKMIEVYE